LGKPARSAISLVLQAAKPFSANSSLAARRISSLLRSRMLDIGPIRSDARGRLAWPGMLAPAFDSPQAKVLQLRPQPRRISQTPTNTNAIPPTLLKLIEA